MRFSFRQLLVGVAFVLCLALAAPSSVWGQNEDVVLQFSPATLQMAVGETVDVAVEVREVTALYGFDVTVAFDPAIVEVVDYDPDQEGIQLALGLFLDPGFVIFNQARNDLGQLRLVMTQLNPSEAKSGSGDLLVIRLRARQAGETPLLLLAGELAQRNGTTFVPQLVDGLVTVSAVSPPSVATPTPIPAQLAGTPLPTTAPDLLPGTAVPTSSATPTGPTPTPVATGTAASSALTSPTPTPTPTATATPPAMATATVAAATAAGEAATVNVASAAAAEDRATAVPPETDAPGSDTAAPEAIALVAGAAETTAIPPEATTAVAVIGSGVSVNGAESGTAGATPAESSSQNLGMQVSLLIGGLLLVIVAFFFFMSRKRQPGD